MDIKKLIETHIQGQGNQIDLGNALPTILNAILDQTDGLIGDLATLETDHKASIVDAINEIFDVLETQEMVVSMMQSNAERKKIYDECVLHPHIAKNIIFYNVSDSYYYKVNGYKMVNGILHLNTIMVDDGIRAVSVKIASNGSISV